MMKLFCIKFKLKSALETPFHADTLFGHLCWAIRYIYGESVLKDFLEAYNNGKPPLILSDGFPEHYLPVPIIPYKQRDKSIGKVQYIHRDKLAQIAHDLSEESLKEKLKEQGKSYASAQPQVIPHATVDRLAGTTVKPQGFFTHEAEFYPADTRFDVFCMIHEQSLPDSLSIDKIKECIQYIAITGFGANKSTGRGVIDVEFQGKTMCIPSVEGNNAFITLSAFCPKPADPTDGYYDLRAKYGRLGGDYAVDKKIPFKYTITMLTPGSVFLQNDPPLTYVGQLLSGVHPIDKEIRQHALAICFPLNLSSNLVTQSKKTKEVAL